MCIVQQMSLCTLEPYVICVIVRCSIVFVFTFTKVHTLIQSITSIIIRNNNNNITYVHKLSSKYSTVIPIFCYIHLSMWSFLLALLCPPHHELYLPFAYCPYCPLSSTFLALFHANMFVRGSQIGYVMCMRMYCMF